MLEPINLSTERLTLRPFQPEDAAAVRLMAGHPEIAATTLTIPHPYSIEAAQAWIAKHYDWWVQGKAYTFAIVVSENSTLVGCIDLNVNQNHGRAELGYWVGHEYWNQGIASEAAQAIIQFGLFGLGLNKITASHLFFNPSSGKVMQKVGMKKEGILRQQIFKSGKFHDSVVYGILRSEN